MDGTMLGRTGLPVAERVDARSGVRERVAFVPFGNGDEQLFVCSYEPVGEPVGSVLICSSILADFLANYHREVILARHLARAGLRVVRFHPRGSGNSDGAAAEVTLASLQADARWAADLVSSWGPDVPLAFLGTRWGALTAAAAAAEHGDAPLVMWEPVTDFPRFFKDALRSRAMSAAATGVAIKGVSQLSELLARDGYADIVGNVVHRSLFDSTVGVDAGLLLAGSPARPGLLVQFGGKELRAPLRKLEQQLSDSGWRVDVTTVDLAESWWFRAGRRGLAQDDLDEATRSWLVARLVARTGVEQG